MKTRVISAFPGTGKSFFARTGRHEGMVVDLDSNAFTSGHTAEGSVRNPDFPENYIAAIDTHIGICEVLFVSPHAEVIKALLEKNIDVMLVYPRKDLKDEYIKRYENRGSAQNFITLLSRRWEAFIDQLESQSGCTHIVLNEGEYLADVLA